ncbi:MAG: hypothetical protein ACJATV_000548 [Granulosicoccus sp.]|jgi:hypothetical protein
MMDTYKKLSLLSVTALVLLITGCQTAPPYDYSALIASKPKSILIIPPNNSSIDVNAPYIFLSTITKPIAEKGYYVFPVAVIDHFLKENGLPTPAEMNTIPLDKIREHIGADAVLYVSIEEWGQKYQVISSTSVVRSTLRLVDTRTGDLLWESTAFAQQQSGDGGGGILGAIIAAAIEQVAGSLIDHTPQLSQWANQGAVNNTRQGLLDGPYKKKE